MAEEEAGAGKRILARSMTDAYTNLNNNAGWQLLARLYIHDIRFLPPYDLVHEPATAVSTPRSLIMRLSKIASVIATTFIAATMASPTSEQPVELEAPLCDARSLPLQRLMVDRNLLHQAWYPALLGSLAVLHSPLPLCTHSKQRHRLRLGVLDHLREHRL